MKHWEDLTSSIVRILHLIVTTFQLDLATWSRILRENLMIPHLVKSPAFYGIQISITISATGTYLEAGETSPWLPPCFFKFDLILSFYLRISGPVKWFLPLKFSDHIFYAFFISTAFCMRRPPHIPVFNYLNNIRWNTVVKFLIYTIISNSLVQHLK
jgi:hypothetical protein